MNLDDKLKELWQNNKLAFLIVVIPVGLAILAYKFRDILIQLLLNDSAKIATDAQKKDDALAQQQAAASAQAAQLVQQAADLPKEQPPVTEDWNKK